MKRLFLIVALAGAVCAAPLLRAHAQQQRPPVEINSPANLMQLTLPVQTRLKLTEEQKGKIDGIRKKLQEALVAAAQEVKDGGDRLAALQKVTATRRACEAEAEALLTDDQKKTLSGLQEQAAQWTGLGRSTTGLLSVDGLTDEQKAKLKALAAETTAKSRTLLQDADRQAAVRKVQELQAEAEVSVKKILTPEQVKQFDASWAAPARLPAASSSK